MSALTSSSVPFQVLTDPEILPPGLTGGVIALGNFDGVHRGHMAVIGRARALAAELKAPCSVLTFEPHPADFFNGSALIFRLTPRDTKIAEVAALGVDGIIILSFDRSIAEMSAEAFVTDILIRRLGVKAVVAGYDFHFGKRREGTPAFLKEAGQRLDFAVEIIERISADAGGSMEAASSTSTRLALEEGDVARAAALLGHPFRIIGPVTEGQRLGRTIGFPTANIVPDPSCRLRHGVYAVRVRFGDETYNAVANYGRRPTVDNGAALLEIFLFDFSGSLYGETLSVDFIDFLRGEQKFPSLDALKEQIAKDTAAAKELLQAKP